MKKMYVSTAIISTRVFEDSKKNNSEILIFVGLSTTKNFTVIVKDRNDPPTGISASGPLSVNENSLSGEYVGTVTTADQDVGQTHQYKIVDVVGHGHQTQRYEIISFVSFFFLTGLCSCFRLVLS